MSNFGNRLEHNILKRKHRPVFERWANIYCRCEKKPTCWCLRQNMWNVSKRTIVVFASEHVKRSKAYHYVVCGERRTIYSLSAIVFYLLETVFMIFRPKENKWSECCKVWFISKVWHPIADLFLCWGVVKHSSIHWFIHWFIHSFIVSKNRPDSKAVDD